jgi:hypothetical protein
VSDATRTRDRLDHNQELRRSPGQEISQVLAAIPVMPASRSASTRRLRRSTTPVKRARASRSRYLRLPGLSCARAAALRRCSQPRARLIIVRSLVRIQAELSNSVAECGFRSRREPLRRDPLCREVIDRCFWRCRARSDSAMAHEFALRRPPRVHNRRLFMGQRGVCRPLAGDHRRWSCNAAQACQVVPKSLRSDACLLRRAPASDLSASCAVALALRVE